MEFIVIGGGCYGTYHSGQLYKGLLKGKLPKDTSFVIVDRNAAPPAMTAHVDKPNFQFVQSDWQAYLQSRLASYDPARDGLNLQIVPAPFAPHLFFDWLEFATLERLQGYPNIEIKREGFEHKMSLPYEYTDPKNGNHFISRADWICPTNCIEPRSCPAVKNIRDWDLDRDLRNFVAGQPVMPSASAALRLQTNNAANGGTRLEDLPPVGHYQGVETFQCHHSAHGVGTVPVLRLFEARERMVNLALTGQSEIRVAIATISHCHGVVATLLMKNNLLQSVDK